LRKIRLITFSRHWGKDIYIYMYKGEGKIHRTTGHEDPEGE